jgi:hypothetical protein
MTNKDEIKFWQKAIKILEKGYGKRCKNFSTKCVQCWAGVAIGFLNDHIDTLKWAMNQNKPKNKKSKWGEFPTEVKSVFNKK